MKLNEKRAAMEEELEEEEGWCREEGLVGADGG